MVESATDNAIVSMDFDGRITAWSPRAERIFGWSAAEAVDADGAMLWTPEDLAAGLPERERRVADAAGTVADDRWHMRRNGTRFWGSGHLTPLRNGRPRGYLKILRDRSVERKAELAQRESEARLADTLEALPVGQQPFLTKSAPLDRSASPASLTIGACLDRHKCSIQRRHYVIEPVWLA